jgi:quinolinate synthase
MTTKPLQTVPATRLELAPDVPICQGDYPLDWYQEEFKPYAEEYFALKDRTPERVLPWLDQYVEPAAAHFGPSLLLLAHFYMGGAIVKLVERYGGAVADSYQLALQARANPDCTVIVQSAVHFMAEAVALLARADQQVWITNPKAGCTLEMHAKEHMVAPVAQWLIERFGDDFAIVAYMNTSGRIKALAGQTGGAACTSANAHNVLAPILAEHGRVLFVPDQHLGRNVAAQLGLTPDDVYLLPDDVRQPENFDDLLRGDFDRLDRAKLVLWPSSCSVHTLFTPEMVGYHQSLGRRVLIHPESPREAVAIADGSGSTRYLWDEVLKGSRGSSFAVGTEGHFVRNLADRARQDGIEVHHLAAVPGFASAGCGCAAMSRNDPPHLAGMLDLLRKGEGPDLNRVIPGDVVDETSLARDRLDEAERAILVRDARLAMERMIALSEG